MLICVDIYHSIATELLKNLYRRTTFGLPQGKSIEDTYTYNSVPGLREGPILKDEILEGSPHGSYNRPKVVLYRTRLGVRTLTLTLRRQRPELCSGDATLFFSKERILSFDKSFVRAN